MQPSPKVRVPDLHGWCLWPKRSWGTPERETGVEAPPQGCMRIRGVGGGGSRTPLTALSPHCRSSSIPGGGGGG